MKANPDNIHYLSRNAARLLLALHTCTGNELLADLPAMQQRAGLTPRTYARALRELVTLGFLQLQDGSIRLHDLA
jgi:hypothetical protein